MSDKVVIETKCPYCKITTATVLDKDRYKEWRDGALIQNVWPEWTKGQRELLISGMHEECWNYFLSLGLGISSPAGSSHWMPEEGPEDDK